MQSSLLRSTGTALVCVCVCVFSVCVRGGWSEEEKRKLENLPTLANDGDRNCSKCSKARSFTIVNFIDVLTKFQPLAICVYIYTCTHMYVRICACIGIYIPLSFIHVPLTVWPGRRV